MEQWVPNQDYRRLYMIAIYGYVVNVKNAIDLKRTQAVKFLCSIKNHSNYDYNMSPMK